MLDAYLVNAAIFSIAHVGYELCRKTVEDAATRYGARRLEKFATDSLSEFQIMGALSSNHDIGKGVARAYIRSLRHIASVMVTQAQFSDREFVEKFQKYANEGLLLWPEGIDVNSALTSALSNLPHGSLRLQSEMLVREMTLSVVSGIENKIGGAVSRLFKVPLL